MHLEQISATDAHVPRGAKRICRWIVDGRTTARSEPLACSGCCFLAEFYQATVRSLDGGSSKHQRSAAFVQSVVCVYGGVLLIGCSQERLLGIIPSPSVCTFL